jgi:hypothetical protein
VLAFGPPVVPTDWRKSVSEQQRGDESDQPAYPDDNGSDPPHRTAVADEAAVAALEAAGECAGGADSPLDGHQLSRLPAGCQSVTGSCGWCGTDRDGRRRQHDPSPNSLPDRTTAARCHRSRRRAGDKIDRYVPFGAAPDRRDDVVM